MISSVTKFTLFALFAGLATASGGCATTGNAQFSSYYSCITAYDENTLSACAASVVSLADECACSEFTRFYNCATSYCGMSAAQVDIYASSMASCDGSAGNLGSMATTTADSTASATLASGATGSAAMASQTSSAGAGEISGSKKVVMVMLAGVAGALI